MKDKIALVVVASQKEETPEKMAQIKAQYADVDSSIDVMIITNDAITGGICKKYNHAIETALKTHNGENEWIVFSHNDAVLKSPIHFVEDVLTKMRTEKNAGIIGVAGTKKVPPVAPGFWWNGIGKPGFEGVGFAEHAVNNEKSQSFMSTYGPFPDRVAAIDGVWFAVNLKILADNQGLRFDEETLEGMYHYYDADFCATARSLGIQMWVGGIHVIHASPGASMGQQSFVLAQSKFVQKWFKKQAQYNNF